MGDETVLSMGIMLWAGILVVVFVLLLLAVDVTCYFVNKCGLIMCLCGKTGTGTKSHNMEERSAAFVKHESKEPIVEVRTEDECTANHNAAVITEPNETTPLTKPELVASLALDTPSSVATNSDTATATHDPAQDSPSSETTTLTCSLSTPANEPSPTPLAAPAPTPESSTAPPTPTISSTAVEAKMAPLLEQRGSITPEEQEKINTPPSTPEQAKPQKSGTPIPPKRRHSPKLAALNAKNSPPVSPLATSSSPASIIADTKKPAPSPPVTKIGTQPVPPNTEKTQTASSPPPPPAPPKPDPDTKPDSSGESFTAEAAVGSGSPSLNPSALQEASDEAPPPPLADTPTPLPITQISSAVTNDLTATDAAPDRVDLGLELRHGTRRAPSRPHSDLISLESPPAPPSLPNGDEAALHSRPLVEASETLAKTTPPVNDEKIFTDDKGRLEEADLPNTLSAAAQNSLMQTNTTESKV